MITNANTTLNTGRCHCNHCTFVLTGEILSCYACHCHICQASTGSVCSLNVWINNSDISLSSGELVVRTYNHNGQQLNRTLCKQCSTTLWFQSVSDDNVLNIQGGTLETPVNPIAHLWTTNAAPWLHNWLTMQVTKNHRDFNVFTTQPESPTDLKTLWQESLK